jgi:phosphoglycolate phosphatase-like HAD superfamily hydrolase
MQNVSQVLFLFDIDGTLVLTGGAGLRALDRAFAQVMALEGACQGYQAGGMTDPLIIEEITTLRLGRGPTPAETNAIFAAYLGFLSEEVATTTRYRIMPGVDAALDAVSARGASVGLATGNVEAGARIKLERGGLWRRFPFGGYGSDAADRGLLVRRAIERGEAHAGRRFAGHEVVVVGDTPRDVAAAHACGAFAVGVATGGDDVPALRAAGADVAFETLEELPAWLAEL